MKLTPKQKQLIKEYANRLILEDFNSDLMRKLNQFKLPIGYAGRYPNTIRTENIMDLLKGLGIRANILSDSNIQYFERNQGDPKRLMKLFPERILIFVNDKYIVGIMRAGKNIRLVGDQNKYVRYKDKLDPKSLSTTDKYKTANATIGGSAMSDKTGLSSLHSIPTTELLSCAYFVITPNDSSVNSSRPNNQGYTPKTLSDILRKKQYEYEIKVKEMRAAKRTGSFPDDILKAAETILSLNTRILEWTKSILDNPINNQYKTVDHSITFGQGTRNSRTYTQSVLKLYINACSRVDTAEKNYKNGSTYSLSEFNEYIKQIEHLIKK